MFVVRDPDGRRVEVKAGRPSLSREALFTTESRRSQEDARSVQWGQARPRGLEDGSCIR